MTSERARRFELHARVRAFIESAARDVTPAEDFDVLALAIASHQAAHSPPYARLLASKGCDIQRVQMARDLPAVPADTFRLTRIAVHPPAEDVAIFRTSGTTSGARGQQALSTTATYEQGALAWGRWAMFCDAPNEIVAIALAPEPGPSIGESSLEFMIQLFASRIAAKAFYLQSAPGVLAQPAALEAACRDVAGSQAPAIVMGTSFAFVHLLDALGGKVLALPPGSRVMHTGGFKGRSREVPRDELIAQISKTFAIDRASVVGEYGMTELSSQLYETTLRASLGFSCPPAKPGTFVAPPWMRVAAADPETLAPLPDGQVGILRFEDLANVDGALVVQTADAGRSSEGLVELLGRTPGAVPRGCSLQIEELMERA